MSEEEIDEEIVIGRHESGILLEEGMITGGRNYCANCKRNVHCHVVVNDGKAEVIMTCKNNDCECKCRTHYACKRCGHLHAYGTECTHSDEEIIHSAESDKIFEEWVEKWTKKKK